MNETGTGPCGYCGSTNTAHVDVLFPVTGFTAAGPVWGQPVVLARCTACGHMTRNIDHITEGADSRPGALVLGIAGPRQPADMTAYGERATL